LIVLFPIQTSFIQLIGEIAIETQSNLVTSSLSSNGKCLAMCNASALFIFRLEFSDGDVEPQKLTLPKELELLTSKLSENGIHVFQRKGSSHPSYWTIPSLAGASPAALKP
jgi:hypothetical protein